MAALFLSLSLACEGLFSRGAEVFSFVPGEGSATFEEGNCEANHDSGRGGYFLRGNPGQTHSKLSTDDLLPVFKPD